MNDLPSTTVLHHIGNGNSSVSIGGNPVVVSAYVEMNKAMDAGFDLVSAGDLWLTMMRGAFNGSIDVNGNAVTLNGNAEINGPIHGSGTLRIFQSSQMTIRGGGSFSGPLPLERWVQLTLESDLPGAAISLFDAGTMALSTTLSGNGLVGSSRGRCSRPRISTSTARGRCSSSCRSAASW